MLRKIYRSVAKHIPAAKYGGAVIEGKKLSPIKFKGHIDDVLKEEGTLSPYELRKILREEGMVKGQFSKLQKFMKMISGDEKKKMTKKEEYALQAKIKARIAAGRYSAEKYAESDIKQLGGMAAKISRARGGKEGALRGALVSKDNTKIGAGAIGVSGPNYKVTSQGGGGSSPSASAGAKRMSGTTSANITRGTGNLGGDSGVGQHVQPPIGFNRMG